MRFIGVQGSGLGFRVEEETMGSSGQTSFILRSQMSGTPEVNPMVNLMVQKRRETFVRGKRAFIRESRSCIKDLPKQRDCY